MTGSETAQHIFERAGLGRAPFRFVGVTESLFQAAPGEPVKAGSSCDFCPASIRYQHWIRDADGHEFKVGSECVRKTGDKGLTKAVDRARRDHERKKRQARKQHKKALLSLRACAALHTAQRDDVRDALERAQHPMIGGKTLLDYVEFCADNGAYAKVVDAVESVVGGAS